jgi:Tol biopolymer transport system component
MSAIRKALGEKANSPRYITTVSGRGYYFTADLQSDAEEDILVETRTLSRIVVEDSEHSEENQFIDASTARIPPLLPPADTFLGRLRETPLLLASGAILLTAGAALAFWYFAIREQRLVLPFENISVKRLTSSGRVTNAALSPDGKLFAYSQEELDGRSSLLLEHIDGSGRVELRPPLFVSYISITFTPDGGRIYYGIMSDEPEGSGLYRLPAFGGAPEKIKDAFWSRVSFSPDGTQLAFVKVDNESKTSSLKITDLLWQNERVVVSRPTSSGFVASTVDWSPDGSRIAVSAVSDETTLRQELFVIDVVSAEVKQLTDSRWDGVRAIAWLGDGKGLIATAGGPDAGWDVKLWHISESDGRAQRLVSDLNAYGIVARLSSDRKALLTAQAQYYSNIWLAPSDDLSSARQLTFDMLGGQNGWFGLEWGPGDRVLYTSYRNKSETIWTMDANGENQRQIIPDGGRNHNVSASADGRLIAFESNRGGTEEIWIANADGSGMRQVTSGGNNSQPHIAPDGRWVIYQAARDGLASLWRISTGSGEPAIQFTKLPSAWARISPDGQSVASHCVIDGKSQLCIFSASGGDPIKLFDVPPRANFRLGAHWVPDGTAVTYRDWGHGLWRQNLRGGEPVRLAGLPKEKIFAYGWSTDGKQFAFSRGMAIQDLVLITTED